MFATISQKARISRARISPYPTSSLNGTTEFLEISLTFFRGPGEKLIERTTTGRFLERDMA